jgi:hypothetical protein
MGATEGICPRVFQREELYEHLTCFHFYNFDYFRKIRRRGVQMPGLLPISARDLFPNALNLLLPLVRKLYPYEITSKIGVLYVRN